MVSRDFPDREIVFEALARGARSEPESTVFVVRGKPNASDAARWAVEALREAGREPVLSENNRAYWGTHASQWRDAELLATCDLVLVFHDRKSATTAYFAESSRSSVKVIERGKPKAAPKRRGRRPVGE